MTLGLCFFFFFPPQRILLPSASDKEHKWNNLNFLLFLHLLINDDYSQIDHSKTLERDESFEMRYCWWLQTMVLDCWQRRLLLPFTPSPKARTALSCFRPIIKDTST